MKAWVVHPVFVAALVTGLNAMKPAAVDDAAYLLLARQIAAHPLDPYGGELFWSAVPEPALHVLAPPVLPYWLAAGIHLVGEDLPLLKLWLFPFPLILCFAVRSLARHFSPRFATVAVPAIALSPLVLPLFGVMLDVPALSLSLAALAVFVRCGKRSWLLSGFLAGLAMQTKYTAFVTPGVILWYGLTHRRVIPALLTGLVAVGLFVAWEGLIDSRYGESHFLYHARSQSAGGPSGWDLVEFKVGRLAFPLLTFSGGLGFGLALFAIPATGWKRGVGWVVSGLTAGLVAVATLPYSQTVFWRGERAGSVRLDLAGLLFTLLGILWLAVLVRVGMPFLLRQRPGRTSLFLTGWVVLEIAAYFALTPFPAGRRVMGIGIAAAFVFFRAADVLGRVKKVRPARWVLPYGIALGLGLFAIDTRDVLPEKELAEEAARFVREQQAGRRVWFNGHWGFQYYCDREGMLPVVPGQSRLAAGDWLVFPVIPDDGGFYRPYHGGAKFDPDPAFLEWKREFVVDDPICGTTIPELYGGKVPMIGTDHPRLRVAVYRVLKDWVPKRVK